MIINHFDEFIMELKEQNTGLMSVNGLIGKQMIRLKKKGQTLEC